MQAGQADRMQTFNNKCASNPKANKKANTKANEKANTEANTKANTKTNTEANLWHFQLLEKNVQENIKGQDNS